jgi:hypothetical protein
MHEEWGKRTGDLFLNDSVFLLHVPGKLRSRAWRISGIQVMAGIPRLGRRPDVPLSIQKVSRLRSMVQCTAVVLCLQGVLDKLYEECCLDCFSAGELGL